MFLYRTGSAANLALSFSDGCWSPSQLFWVKAENALDGSASHRRIKEQKKKTLPHCKRGEVKFFFCDWAAHV